MKSAVKILFAIFLTLLISSCAGGSRGTGGITFEGRITQLDGTPEPNFAVSILETGDTGLSDENGNFSIQTERRSSYGLLFEREQFSAVSEVTEIPSNASRVRGSFVLDEENGEVRNERIEIDEDSESDDEDRMDQDDSRDDDVSEDSSAPSGSGPSSDDDDSAFDDEQDDDNSSSSPSGSADSASSDDDNSDDSNDGSSDDSRDDDDDDSRDNDEEDEDDNDSGSSDEGDDNDASCEEQDASGTITDLSTSSITVSGITFAITSETDIDFDDEDRELALGQSVEVEGECENGILIADSIEDFDS